MRKDFHFGEEDPLFFPQPYTAGIGHLSVIPMRTSEASNPHSAAWTIPSHSDFEPAPSADPSRGLGMLSLAIRRPLQACFDSMVQRISTITLDEMVKDPSQRSNLRNDPLTTRYIFTIKFLLARLKSLSSYREAAMTFSLCQRAYLELTGRVEWLATYRALVHNPPTVRSAEDAHVVGALTGDDETAHRLFYAGIPVWFSQPGYRKEYTHVDRWIKPESDPRATLQRVLDSHPHFSLEDDNPPHPVIFEGAVTDANRYAKMGEYVRQFSTTNVYMENATAIPSTLTPTSSSSSGPSRSSKTSNRHNPIQTPNMLSRSNPNNDCNKFVDVDSPLMPPALKVWAEASQSAGSDFNPNTPPPTGRNNGYALPDPSIIASTKNEPMQAAFITMWLKLRQVLVYRLQSPTFVPLRAKEWRSVLGLEIHGLKAGAGAAKARDEQQKMLQSCLQSGNMGRSVDLSDLGTAPVMWQGTSITPFALPPKPIVQEILWELFEVNFCYELVALDRFCFQTGVSIAEREQEVLGLVSHLNSSLVPENTAQGRIGFASTDLNTAAGRRHALHGLYRVMADWTGGPGQLPRPLVDGAVDTRLDITRTSDVPVGDFEALEFAVVHHYVSVFRSMFNRAPLLPHALR
ncbi:hypothetical protein PQX77_021589 [Marasmius sp. AFHP31]|nr:hypothetical protein PQX77_021589 [Marasmius sp. AFHP31]